MSSLRSSLIVTEELLGMDVSIAEDDPELDADDTDDGCCELICAYCSGGDASDMDDDDCNDCNGGNGDNVDWAG